MNTRSSKIILAIGGHPADVFDNAAGTLINHVKAGDRISLVTITHGAFSHASMYFDRNPEEIIKLKDEEWKLAAEAVGAENSSNLYYDDEPLMLSKEIIFKLAVIIQKERPDVIITHHPHEYVHPDHGPAGEMVLRAIKAAGRRKLSKDSLVEVKSVYLFGHQGRSLQGKLGYGRVAPDVVIDIEEVIDKKASVLGIFKSQKYACSYLKHRLYSVEAGFGFMHGYKYAEHFISLYPFKGDLLPIMHNASVSGLIQRLYNEEVSFHTG